MLFGTFVLLLLSVVTGFILRAVALRRGGSGRNWFIIGLFLGPIALVCIPFIQGQK